MKPTHLAQATLIHKQNNEKELMKAALNDKQLGAELATESVAVQDWLMLVLELHVFLCSVSNSFVPCSIGNWFSCVDCFIFHMHY